MSTPSKQVTQSLPDLASASASNHGDETAASPHSAGDSPPADAPAFAPPAVAGEVGRLGKYRLRKLLGRGGMGLVYLAFDETLRRQVALKVMLPKAAAHAGARGRFLREARAAAGVTSDHVVAIYEADEADGIPFIALQYLEGYPLDVYLKRKGVPSVPQSVRIAREAALGLAAAHRLGLVHRDIKPGNLWLEAPNGRVKVLDFGLAKPADGIDAADAAELTAAGAIVGTPAYMAPEQARGERPDGRADLFSLGCVLYRLLTGRLPFDRPTLMGTLTALATEEPTPVRQLNPAVPEPLAALVRRLMAKDPADRPPTADAVARELAALADAPPHGSATTPQVVYVPLQVTVQELSPFAGLTESGGPTAPRSARTAAPPVKTRLRPAVIVALAFLPGFALVLAGFIVIKITNKDGTVTEIKVPDDAKVEVIRDKKPDVPAKPKPATAKADEQLADAVRKLLDNKFTVMVAPIDGPQTYRAVKSVEELRPGERIYHFAAFGSDKLAAFDNPANLAVLQSLPEVIAGPPGTSFGIQGGAVTAAHVRAFHATPQGKNFTCLNWSDVTSSDEAVAELRRYKTFVMLTFCRVQGLTEKSFQTIAVAFPEMYRLTLSDLDVPPSFLSHFRATKLRWLDLGAMPQIDDGSVESLAAIKTLTHLTLKGCKLTPEGVKRLAAALPRCRIEWDGGVIEPTPAK